MDAILNDVNWVVVLVGAIVSFIVGSIWYSPMLFGNGWRKGLGVAAVPGRSLGGLLVVEAIACLVFAWLIVLTLESSMALAVLAAIVVAFVTKSNSLFSGKSLYATAVESAYVLVKAAIVIVTYQIFK